MGIQERKEREKEQRRSDIVDAAEQVFAQKGFGSATMDDVAERAELSKGTLYLYFNTKEELFLAVAARGLEVLGNLFMKASEDGETGAQKSRAIGNAYIGFVHEHPTYYAAISYFGDVEIDWEDNSNPNAHACHDLGMRVLSILEQAICVGMQDKSLRDDLNPPLTGLWLWTQLSGILQFVSTRKGEIIAREYGVTKQQLIDEAFALAMRAIAN